MTFRAGNDRGATAHVPRRQTRGAKQRCRRPATSGSLVGRRQSWSRLQAAGILGMDHSRYRSDLSGG